MQRVATFMAIRQGRRDEYIQAHQNVWPKVLEGIKRVGISNYSIFIRGHELYSYFEVDDLDEAMTKIAADPVNQRWQEHMAPFLDVGLGLKDGSTAYLEEVFHAEGYTHQDIPMQRVAMYLRVKEGHEDSYREAHRHVWPIIYEQIERTKIRNYSIFMSGRDLFIYFEVANLERAMAELAADPENQRWQEHMSPLMDVDAGLRDSSTVYMQEVFHLE
jgi:L-rhamnose mutarotase